MVAKTKAKILDTAQVSNGAAEIIDMTRPFKLTVTVEGVADLLLHGWNIEAVEEKSKAAKGSKAKKTDDLESYIYRTKHGTIALVGDALRAAMAEAGRYHQDPRSPRKSARDMVKAALVPLEPLADTGEKEWHYVAAHRVVVQRASITRRRPALNAGWRITFQMLNNLPEYLTSAFLQTLITDAGQLCGLGDYRPTYGRFSMVGFEITDY